MKGLAKSSEGGDRQKIYNKEFLVYFKAFSMLGSCLLVEVK